MPKWALGLSIIIAIHTGNTFAVANGKGDFSPAEENCMNRFSDLVQKRLESGKTPPLAYGYSATLDRYLRLCLSQATPDQVKQLNASLYDDFKVANSKQQAVIRNAFKQMEDLEKNNIQRASLPTSAIPD